MRLLLLSLLLIAHLPASETLIVYSGRAENLAGPLLDRARAATGLAIEVRYGTTPALAAQLAAEGAQTPCDVFLAQEGGYLQALADASLLAPLPAATAARVDARFRDPSARWMAISGRLRVLVLDSTIPAGERPTSLADLADPRWKGQIGWAPGNASFQAHVSVLRATWGEERTRTWLKAVAANGARSFPKNGPQITAVDRGEIRIGWTNHYYLHQARRSGPGKAINHSFASTAAEGNVLMVSGVARTAASKRAGAAEQLIAWLVSPEAQKLIADGFEYPVVADVPALPEITPLADIPLITVDQRVLTDLAKTLDLLRELGLQ
jgi:iron(III) transport system substrate-binding protein